MHIKFPNPTLAMHDGDRLLKISKGIRCNGLIEDRLGRDSSERYPPASD